MDVTSDERRKVVDVEKGLSAQTEGTESAGSINKPISLRLTPDERAALADACQSEGMTLTNYVKARIFGLGTRDRTVLRLVNSLHVSGLALIALLAQDTRLDGSTRVEIQRLIKEMRGQIESLGKKLS